MRTKRTSALLAAAVIVAAPPSAPAQKTEPRGPTTYCNPIALPNYPLAGRRDATVGAPVPKDDWLWLVDKQQFRELADVSVLWHEGAWYLYPSVDMAWVSKDGGATWQHDPLNVRALGYAPTIVKHEGKFPLRASESPVDAADGPFKEIGRIERPAGVPGQIDPIRRWLCSEDGARNRQLEDHERVSEATRTPRPLGRSGAPDAASTRTRRRTAAPVAATPERVTPVDSNVGQDVIGSANVQRGTRRCT